MGCLQEMNLLKDAMFTPLMCSAARRNNVKAIQQLIEAVSKVLPFHHTAMDYETWFPCIRAICCACRELT